MLQLAFPSWVKEGGIAENATFICGRWQGLCDAGAVPSNISPRPEIGLCFFETAACVAYGPEDLPASLAGLPCTWHMHLPLDLPFCSNSRSFPRFEPDKVRESFCACKKLMQKCEFLNISSAVLHPPVLENRAESAQAISMFKDLWVDAGYSQATLLLENQPESDLTELALRVRENDLGACLDLAHLYMNPAQKIDFPGLDEFVAQARLWHINAPGPDYKGHCPLSALSSGQELEYQALLGRLNQNTSPTLMLELFKWEHIEQSLPRLFQYLCCF